MIVTVTFRDELTKASMTNYLQPIIKQQGESYGLISMTSTDITDLSILAFIRPDYKTARSSNEYGAKIRDALQKAGAKVETKEGPVARAWFNGIEDLKSLSNF